MSKTNYISKYLGQFVFILLPIIAVVYFILWNCNQYFTFLQSQWLLQTVYFSIGLLIAYYLFQTRLRFITSSLALAFLLFSAQKTIENFAVGEFDGFFIAVQFQVFAYLFFTGWIIGWGMSRVSFFATILSTLFVLLCIYLISKTGHITPVMLLQYFSPIAIYAIYILYTSQNFRVEREFDKSFWWRFGKRFIVFAALLFTLFGGVVYFMFDEIKARIEEYGGQGKEGENQMLQQNKDGSVENKKSMGFATSNQRNKNPEPLFCAHIENYFEGTQIANPLYLTSYHYTKFDTLTETFERDSVYSGSDEFQPNPAEIGLFSTLKDSSRITNALSNKFRKTVSIEVYKKRLSAKAFVAPSTSFYVQPITIEKEFQKEFKSAYRAKSYVSSLNSAYFIYNTTDPFIQSFQSQRFSELRKAKSYEGISDEFMKYHTFFPNALQYQAIQVLADSLAKGKKTTIDKVLSVRDYFLQRNSNNEQVYTYSDNPGIPGLPGASKITNFLFETKKGYCAYYAGATLFMLRAMKIPSRLVTGFLTVDRSDKNPGWYWFYEDQSHAWVQVYFPEYGWLDFDTTVGNDEAEQSPSPDGTPPMQPPNPVLALSGKIISIDTIQKLLQVKLNNLIFRDVEYVSIDEQAMLDVSVCNIWKDSLPIKISDLKIKDDVMGVSYVDALTKFSIERNVKPLLNKLPKKLPIDDLFIKSLKQHSSDKKKVETIAKTCSWRFYIAIVLGSCLVLFLGILLLPSIFYRYLKWKAKHAKRAESKAYYVYRASMFLAKQHGLPQNNLSPLQFAKTKVDMQLNTQLTQFMYVYLKLKFSKQSLTNHEKQFIDNFLQQFETKINTSFKRSQRFRSFVNINRFIDYFYMPELESN
jgi:transglutaminase-like putative cysteine protease